MDIKDAKSTMRIAFVSHVFDRNDGQGRVNYEVVKAALARGYHVTVLATRCAVDIANHPNAHFVPCGRRSLPTAFLRNMVFARSSAKWLRKHKSDFDITQSNGFVTWELCDISAAHFVHAEWRKSPYYPFTGYSPYSLYQRLFTFLNTRWERTVFTQAKRVIAVSKRVGREVETLGVPRSSIDVIANGVDTSQFCPGPSDRRRFGLPADVPLGLFVGDIRTPRKNLDTVLKALQTVPTLHLAVAGAVKGSRYPAMASELNLAKRVTFLDSVKEMEILMRSVDLFIFPSRYEPFGLVALEAMASGVPVISSADAGIADYLGGGGLILSDPNDAGGLAHLLEQLLEDRNKRVSMGTAGRERALRMQWSAMATKYLEVYERFIEGQQA